MEGTYDIAANTAQITVFAPASKTNTITGATIDCQGFSSLMYLINVGAVTTLDATDYWQFADNVGNASDGSDKVAVGSATYQDPTINSNASGLYLGKATAWASPYQIGNGNNSASTVYKIGVSLFDTALSTGLGRYHTLVGTATGTPSAIIGVIAVLGTPIHGPSLGPAVV